MVYRQDNRPKRHRGRYTILGIVLGVCITIGGIYVYENYKGQITENVSQIEDKTIQVVQKTYPTIKVDTNPVNQNDQINTNAETQTQQQQPTKIDTLTLEKEIHDQINKMRIQYNLQPLKYDEKIATIAREHSNDMVTNNYFDHTSSDGKTVQERFISAKYPCFPSGENIEMTSISFDAYSVVDLWMNSSGHRANILQNIFNSEGIGVTVSGNSLYITEDFC